MQRITRASNAETSTRRTTEEVQAERQAKAVAKANAAAEKQANIMKVAQLENKARDRVNDANRKANHPTDKLTIPRAKRARKEDATDGSVSETQADNPEEPPKTKKAKTTETTTTQSPVVKPMSSKSKNIVDETQVVKSANNTTRALSVDDEVAAGPEESADSGSDYGKSKDDTSSEDEDNIDLENDEPDTAIKHKSGGGKKPKKGLVARDQINMFAGIDKNPKAEAVKRKAVTETGTGILQSTKRAKQSQPSGLISNWETAPYIRPPVSNKKKSSNNHPGNADGEVDDDSPAFTFGRIPSDDEEPERLAIANSGTFKTKMNYRSIAKIEELHSVPSPRINLANPPQKKSSSATTADLPHGTASRFSKLVIPMACETTGALNPWEHPTDEMMADIWNLVFDNPNHIADGDFTSGLFIVVKKLIKNGISMWLNKFAGAAVKALEAEFVHQKISTIAEKSEFVRFLLGDADNLSSKNRPFLWQSVYDDPDARQEGLFQGRLVARTFLKHVLVLSSVPLESRVAEKPVGALIVSIQAVHRALLYYVTGVFEAPTHKNESAFSKNNWDDLITQTPTSIEKQKRASVFLNRIKKLKDEHWDDIFEAALAMREQGAGKVKAEVLDLPEEEGEDDDDDDDELLDPKYDTIPEPSDM